MVFDGDEHFLFKGDDEAKKELKSLMGDADEKSKS